MVQVDGRSLYYPGKVFLYDPGDPWVTVLLFNDIYCEPSEEAEHPFSVRVTLEQYQEYNMTSLRHSQVWINLFLIEDILIYIQCHQISPIKWPLALTPKHADDGFNLPMYDGLRPQIQSKCEAEIQFFADVVRGLIRDKTFATLCSSKAQGATPNWQTCGHLLGVVDPLSTLPDSRPVFCAKDVNFLRSFAHTHLVRKVTEDTLQGDSAKVQHLGSYLELVHGPGAVMIGLFALGICIRRSLPEALRLLEQGRINRPMTEFGEVWDYYLTRTDSIEDGSHLEDTHKVLTPGIKVPLPCNIDFPSKGSTFA